MLAVSFRVHLETEVFATLMWRVLRVFVRRIRGPRRVGPNVHHPPLEDLRKVVDVSCPVLTVATELLATRYAGLPRFHHRVLTQSVDVHRALDVLAVSVRVHLETEVSVTLRWRVSRAFVCRIRDLWRVGPNVLHPPLEDLRKVVDVSRPVMTDATHSATTASVPVLPLSVIPANCAKVGRLPGCPPCAWPRGRNVQLARPDDNSYCAVGVRQVGCCAREVILF